MQGGYPPCMTLSISLLFLQKNIKFRPKSNKHILMTSDLSISDYRGHAHVTMYWPLNDAMTRQSQVIVNNPLTVQVTESLLQWLWVRAVRCVGVCVEWVGWSVLVVWSGCIVWGVWVCGCSVWGVWRGHMHAHMKLRGQQVHCSHQQTHCSHHTHYHLHQGIQILD